VTDVSTPAEAERVADSSMRPMMEDFLYREANLLDDWKLLEWLDLFAPDGRYLVPATDVPNGDPLLDLYLVNDDRFLLEQRVRSLLKKTAHAEYPRSRTRRLVGSVQVGRLDDIRIWVTATFILHRMRHGHVDLYVGTYQHILADRDGRLGYLERKAVLDNEALRPQGKVSIIL
jgi:p-cumate 2,3-dioxygenase subunit beta